MSWERLLSFVRRRPPVWTLQGSALERLMTFIRLRDYYGAHRVTIRQASATQIVITAAIPGPCVLYDTAGRRHEIARRDVMELTWDALAPSPHA